MKIWRAFTGMCVVLSLLTGCANQEDYNELYDDTGKWSSQLDGVFDTPDLACVDQTIAYMVSYNLCFYDVVEEKITKISLAEDEGVSILTAGKEYFYAVIRNNPLDDPYSVFSDSPEAVLRIYYPDGTMYKEVSVPFQLMYVSDGMIYAYYEPDVDFSACVWKVGHIEATHYLSEEEFLTDLPDQLSDWNEINGGDSPQIGSKTFYQYPADGYMHTKTYYCDEKYLNQDQQFYFTEYIDGELVTRDHHKMDARYLEQMYSMMREKEENWVTYAWEVEGTLYGVCNIYQSSSGFLAQMDTSGIDYSISFCYNEDTDSLNKIDEYEDVELIYADKRCVLTHTVDCVYYKDLVTGEEEKILDYDSVITVTVRDGLLSLRRLGNELIGVEIQGDEVVDGSYVVTEQEEYWGIGTLLIKKLW